MSFWNRHSRDLRTELDSHIDERVDELLESGMDEASARLQARREFGNRTLHLESSRKVWSWPLLESLWKDLCYAARSLRSAPLFTLIVVAILAAGIGANVSVFTLVNAALLKPLPAANPEQLVRLRPFLTYEDYLVYSDLSAALSGLALYRFRPLAVGASPEVEWFDGSIVTGNYFQVLGVAARLGRTLTPADDEVGAAGAVVISDRIWRRRFGSDPEVLDQTLVVEDRPFRIVGVAPPGFRGVDAPNTADVWLTWNVWEAAQRASPGYAIGRLAVDRSIAEVRSELRLIEAPGEASRPLSVEEARTLAIATQELHTPIALLSGFVSLILVVACANLGSLMLGRSAARRREIGIRLALGASRTRLVRLLLIESLLLSALGGGAAIAVGTAGSRAYSAVRIAGVEVLRSLDLGFDWRVGVFILALSVSTTALFGLAPAVAATRTALLPSLAEGHWGAERSARWRGAFISVQFAASFVLLVTAAICVQGMVALQILNPGFDTDGVFVLRIDPPSEALDRLPELRERLIERLNGSPGVMASLAGTVPFMFSGDVIEIEDEGAGTRMEVETNHVSPGYFRTLGIPIVAGRDFDQADRLETPAVAIVNETLARRLWPDQSPLGKRFRTVGNATDDPGTLIDVVAVAGDSRYRRLDEDQAPFVYLPLGHGSGSPEPPDPLVAIIMKTAASEAEALALAWRELRSLDPSVRPPSIMPLEALVDTARLPMRILSALTGTLGIIALALASVGSYGVVAYLTAQRRIEIAVSVAVGATAAQIVERIIRPVMAWSLAGIGGGCLLTVSLSRILQATMGPIPYSPLAAAAAFVTASVLLAGTACASGVVPTLRALRNDPAQALRN